MGALTPQFANQFSTDILLANAAPNGAAFAFGFNASYVRVINLAEVPIRVNLGSTGAATTDHALLLPGKDISLYDIPIGGGSVMTTSTTTSTDATGHMVSVSAWGV